jgi:hypothetical protein
VATKAKELAQSQLNIGYAGVQALFSIIYCNGQISRFLHQRKSEWGFSSWYYIIYNVT